MLPDDFVLAQYRFTIEALEPLNLPPMKSSALRGGFGHTFKKLVCRHHCDKACQLENLCPYGYIFETTPPEQSDILSKFSDIPRPFVITPPADTRTELETGDQLSFGLILIGYAVNLLPYFIAVFRALGQVGLGKNRGKYQLVRVEAVSPYTRDYNLVYTAQQGNVYQVEAQITGEVVRTHAGTLAPEQATLEFLTPVQIKHQGRILREGPPFIALIKTLLGRVTALSYFHCGQFMAVNFGEIYKQAEMVEITACRTHEWSWSRYSGRQRKRIRMDGLVGPITYAGDLAPFLPLLALGELVHVGKKTVFGNGQYVIRANDDVY